MQGYLFLTEGCPFFIGKIRNGLKKHKKTKDLEVQYLRGRRKTKRESKEDD